MVYGHMMGWIVGTGGKFLLVLTGTNPKKGESYGKRGRNL